MSGWCQPNVKGLPTDFNGNPIERDKEGKCVKCGRVVSDAVLRHNCPQDAEPDPSLLS